jgi:hypothetical protein
MQGLFSNNDESMCQILTNFCRSFLGENEEKHENSTKSKAIKKKEKNMEAFLKCMYKTKATLLSKLLLYFLKKDCTGLSQIATEAIKQRKERFEQGKEQ